jgi:KEOPS complex subunit Pcc1
LRKAVFTFELGPEKNKAVLAALRPEASREIPRATAKVRLEGGRLLLEISSEDSASLRAAVNSYLRWVKVAAEAPEAGENAQAEKKKQAPPGRAGAKRK